jgi:hypothetical protein
MHPSLRDVAGYYRRVLRRGFRDARGAISRTGVAVGLIAAVVAAAVNAVLDKKFDFASTAIAACAGALFVAALAVLWRITLAPIVLATEDEHAHRASAEQALAGARRSALPPATALSESESERRRLQALVDAQAPKMALIEQLRKSDALFPNFLALINAPEDEREDRRRHDANAVRSWVFETRNVLKEHAPEYADQFVIKSRLPLDISFVKQSKPAPAPPTRDVITHLNEARASLSRVIRQL